MAVKVATYINFNGNAREAFTFYQSVFGGELALNTFGEFNADPNPANQDKLMHAMLTMPNGEVLMGADTPSMMEYKTPCGFSVSLTGDDAEQLREYYAKLSEGGTITMPMEKQIWGDEFGMVLDKFGINWMINIFTPAQ